MTVHKPVTSEMYFQYNDDSITANKALKFTLSIKCFQTIAFQSKKSVMPIVLFCFCLFVFFIWIKRIRLISNLRNIIDKIRFICFLFLFLNNCFNHCNVQQCIVFIVVRMIMYA